MSKIEINGKNYPIDTPDQRVEAMRAAINHGDTEYAHIEADEIVAVALMRYEPRLAELFEDMDKWYA